MEKQGVNLLENGGELENGGGGADQKMEKKSGKT